MCSGGIHIIPQISRQDQVSHLGYFIASQDTDRAREPAHTKTLSFVSRRRDVFAARKDSARTKGLGARALRRRVFLTRSERNHRLAPSFTRGGLRARCAKPR